MKGRQRTDPLIQTRVCHKTTVERIQTSRGHQKNYKRCLLVLPSGLWASDYRWWQSHAMGSPTSSGQERAKQNKIEVPWHMGSCHETYTETCDVVGFHDRSMSYYLCRSIVISCTTTQRGQAESSSLAAPQLNVVKTECRKSN